MRSATSAQTMRPQHPGRLAQRQPQPRLGQRRAQPAPGRPRRRSEAELRHAVGRRHIRSGARSAGRSAAGRARPPPPRRWPAARRRRPRGSRSASSARAERLQRRATTHRDRGHRQHAGRASRRSRDRRRHGRDHHRAQRHAACFRLNTSAAAPRPGCARPAGGCRPASPARGRARQKADSASATGCAERGQRDAERR